MTTLDRVFRLILSMEVRRLSTERYPSRRLLDQISAKLFIRAVGIPFRAPDWLGDWLYRGRRIGATREDLDTYSSSISFPLIFKITAAAVLELIEVFSPNLR